MDHRNVQFVDRHIRILSFKMYHIYTYVRTAGFENAKRDDLCTLIVFLDDVMEFRISARRVEKHTAAGAK